VRCRQSPPASSHISVHDRQQMRRLEHKI
jgi:hypothetical protein